MSQEHEDTMRVEEVPQEPILKVKRTYGRKKDVVDALDGAPSHDVSSYPTRHEPIGKSGMSDHLCSTRYLSNDASDAFGWKEKLALIDKHFDEVEGQVANKSTSRLAYSRASKDDSSGQSTSTEDGSSGLHDETLLSSSALAPVSSQSDPPSPGPSVSKGVETKTSCSDSDANMHQLKLHGPINLASGTPSASEDEDDLKPVAKQGVSDARNVDGLQLESKGTEQLPSVGKRKGKQRETNTIKKLSKKEEKASKKAHARIMADQKVSISKRAEQYTVEHLLKSVRQGQLLSEMRPSIASSDPIQDFTSSPSTNHLGASTEIELQAGPSGLESTSDDGMPNTHELLKKQTEQKEDEKAEAQRRKSLTLMKRRTLESLKFRVADSDSDDDGLEVVTVSAEGTAKQPKVSSVLEKKLANVAGFRAGSSRCTLSEVLESSQTERALKLAAKPTFADRDARRARATVNHRDLQATMLSKAAKQSVQLTKEKEEEWKRRGGKLAAKQRAVIGSQPLSLGHLAESLALQRRSGEQTDGNAERHEDASESENTSDEKWQPREGVSMSPSSHQGHSQSDMDKKELQSSLRDQLGDGADVMEELTDANENEDEDHSRRMRQERRPTKRLVVSDSEDEEAHPQQTFGRILVPETSEVIDDNGHRSASSTAAVDEENKENDTPADIDSGDDKENVMLAQRPAYRRTTTTRQSETVSGLEDRARRSSISPRGAVENEEAFSVRKPLQAMKLDELGDPFVLRSPSSATSPETPKSKRTLSAAGSPLSLQPAFDGRFGGFTQFFNDEEGIHTGSHSTGLLQPAFRLHVSSDVKRLSARATPKLAKTDDDSTTPPSPKMKKQSKYLARNDELSLTLDIKLQPALDVSTQVRRRADVVFEKEQDFLLEEASTSATSTLSKQELYVSENGLLTQTMPEGSTPLLYRSWTPSQKPIGHGSEDKAPPSTTQRLPLSTLSLADDAVSPSQQRLRRLTKGKNREEFSDSGDIHSPSLKGVPTDAFRRLLEGAKQHERKISRKFVNSHFVEGEAVESDEDELFGFGQPMRKGDDEESDEDDPDAAVENLVDDRSMDAQEIAEDKVLEKVKEQLEEDDAALQKYHQAAIEGKYRGKRRGGGIAMDNSESDEDEDEEARRLRRRMHKKRRIQGDKLEDLKKDERSRVFYEAYQCDIQEEDNDDFAHPGNDEMVGEDNLNDEDEEPETVSTMEVMEQLRKVARQQQGKERQFQPASIDDMEWIHTTGTSDDELEVKEIDDRPKKTVRRRPVFGQIDVPDFDDSLPRKPNKLSEEQAAQLAAWRKEQSGRNLGAGGMRGAITVTGHGPKMCRTGTTAKSGPSRQGDGDRPVRRKVTKTASMLASVADKHSRFGL